MAVSYTKIYQDATTLPAEGATSQFNVSNPIPQGLVESFIVQIKGTGVAGGTTASTLTTIFNNLRIVFNGDQWFNFNTPVDSTAASVNSRLNTMLQDIGGFTSENVSNTAVDMSIVIPCGINLPANSRFEVDLTYFALAAGNALTGANFELWAKYGSSSNATIVGNATSFPIPAASQTLMTVAIPSYKGAKVSGIALQSPTSNDNLATCVVQVLGQFGMTPTYIRGASGASQNGYMYLDTGTDSFGLVPSSSTAGYYFIPTYDLDVSSGSLNLLITTVAGAGTENYTATPILKLPTGGRGESTPTQTASVATGSSQAVLRRAEE